MRKLSVFLLLLLVFNTVAYADNEYPNTYVNTGVWAEDIVGVAEGQVGYSEKYRVGGADLRPDQDGGYTKYGAAYNNPYAPWCTYFILWCAKEAEIPNSVICSSGACGNPEIMVNWFKNTSSWHGNEYIPVRGDIVFLDMTGDRGADHAGIVRGVSDDGEKVYTVEGNCGGRFGYTTAREIRRENILGYGTPRYHMAERLNGRVTLNSAAYFVPGAADFSTLLWTGTELEVLCTDGDYYLVNVPYYYSGAFRIFYIHRAAVRVNGEVMSAESYYNIKKRGRVLGDCTLYCRASEDSLRSGITDVTVRGSLKAGERVEVLYEENGFYFVRTASLCGFASKNRIEVTD